MHQKNYNSGGKKLVYTSSILDKIWLLLSAIFVLFWKPGKLATKCRTYNVVNLYFPSCLCSVFNTHIYNTIIYMHVHGFQQKTNHFQSTIFTVHWNFPIVLFIVGRHLSSHQHPVITKYSSFQVNFVKNLPKLYKIALRYSLSPSYILNRL